MASSKSPSTRQTSNLSAADWSRAALDSIAEGGVEQVTVEGLARHLGVTKGSFYWHFADRTALVVSALDLWEQLGTLDIIERLQRVRDPKARLRALFATAFGDIFRSVLDGYVAARGTLPPAGPHWFVFMIGGWLGFTRRNIVRCLAGGEAANGPDLALCHEEVRNGLHGLPDMFGRLPELEDLLV